MSLARDNESMARVQFRVSRFPGAMQREALLRRTGIVPATALCYGPGSAAHHAAEEAARCAASGERSLTCERPRDRVLRLVLDAAQMVLAEKTFRVDLVDVFRAGGARGEPAIVGRDLDAAEWLVAAGSSRQR